MTCELAGFAVLAVTGGMLLAVVCVSARAVKKERWCLLFDRWGDRRAYLTQLYDIAVRMELIARWDPASGGGSRPPRQQALKGADEPAARGDLVNPKNTSE